MVENIEANLPDICLYLMIEETLSVIAFVKKDWKEILLTESFVSFWIKSFFNIKNRLSFSELKKIYMNHKNNSVLDFEGWKAEGGLSEIEVNSSYSNMWTYNPTPYSTYYSTNDPIPLKRNLNCLASFKGGYQDKDNFFHAFNNDLYSMSIGNPPPQDKYKVESHVIHKCLTIDPLRIEKFNDITSFAFDYEFHNQNSQVFNSSLIFNVKPPAAPALVSKIAIARPFNYTGAIRTLMIIVSSSWKELEFQDFQEFDNVFNLDAARCVANVKKELVDDDFNVVEYDRGEGLYPLVWVEFKQLGCNHLEYQLTQAHEVWSVNAKMYDIDDRREDWGLNSYQANFDILYVVMIGSDLAQI